MRLPDELPGRRTPLYDVLQEVFVESIFHVALLLVQQIKPCGKCLLRMLIVRSPRRWYSSGEIHNQPRKLTFHLDKRQNCTALPYLEIMVVDPA